MATRDTEGRREIEAAKQRLTAAKKQLKRKPRYRSKQPMII